MGIVNVTPDSFSDGGRYYAADAAIAHAERLAKEGADIIDIGGESTRPFSKGISAQEEIKRVVPVIKEVKKRISLPISIDTTKVKVAKRSLEAGASIINDISALTADPKIADLVKEFKAPIILMHMKKTPKDMQVAPHYIDLISEITNFLKTRIEYAISRGIPRSMIIADPGIGFGKSFDHNLMIIRNLNKFETLDVPILIGPSRKAFIRNLLKDEVADDIGTELPEVETGTQAAISASILKGAHIVRVHNAANTLSTVKIIDAIKLADL